MTIKTVLTTIGLAKILNAVAFGEPLSITKMALGDGLITPIESMTALSHEVWRGALDSLEIDPENTGNIIARVTVPDDIGGWTVRECGLYDSNGFLIAIGNIAETEKVPGYVSLTVTMAVAIGAADISGITLTPAGPYIHLSEKGKPGGVAKLDSEGKLAHGIDAENIFGMIPPENLPTYLGDVLEFVNTAAFPAAGAGATLYIADDTGLVYRWDGVAYTKVAGGGSGGGPIPGNVEIKIPTDYATWDLARAYLDANVFTGRVTVVLESAYPLGYQIYITDLNMPNLFITTDGEVSVDASTFVNPFGVSIFMGVLDSIVGGLSGAFKQIGGPATFALMLVKSDLVVGDKNPLTATAMSLTMTDFNLGAQGISSKIRGNGGTWNLVLGASSAIAFTDTSFDGVNLVTDATSFQHSSSGIGSDGVMSYIDTLKATNSSFRIESGSGQLRISHLILEPEVTFQAKAVLGHLEFNFDEASTIHPAGASSTLSVFETYRGGEIRAFIDETLTIAPNNTTDYIALGDEITLVSSGATGIIIDSTTAVMTGAFFSEKFTLVGAFAGLQFSGAGNPVVFPLGVNHPQLAAGRVGNKLIQFEEVFVEEASVVTPYNTTSHISMIQDPDVPLSAVTVDLAHSEALEVTVNAFNSITTVTAFGTTFSLAARESKTYWRSYIGGTWMRK